MNSKLIDKLCGEKLPSKKEVLSRFVYSRSTTGRKSFAESLKECAFEVERIWSLANIPTQNICRVRNKINSLYEKWNLVRKNQKRRTDQQLKIEQEFSGMLETLFDISYNDSLKKMETNDKKRLGIGGNSILVAHQLDERKAYYDKLNEINAFEFVEVETDINEMQETNTRTNDPTNELQEYVECDDQSECDPNNNDENDIDIDSDSDSELELVSIAPDICDSADDSDEEYLPSNKYRKKTPKKKVIMTPMLSAALDRTITSDREAVFLLIAAAFSMELDANNMVINRESIRQSREKHREQKAMEIHEDFNPTVPLVLHWDGKLLHNAKFNKKVDRVAIIVTGDGVSQTLNIPYLKESNARNQAELLYNTIQKWPNVMNLIHFICFDTTSLNTGRIKGTCLRLQKLIGKRLLWLACRHHIMEIVVSAAYKEALSDQSTGPNIQLFEQFRNKWNDIDKSKYESCMQDFEVLQHLLPVKDDIINFINDQLKNFPTTRDDYRELLVLTLLVLGEKPPEYKIRKIQTYVVHTCGALHRARWMARLIYSLKIYLFRFQFELSSTTLLGLKQFIIFVIRVYIKNWYQAPCTVRAANNDLKLLKEIAQFKLVNERISKVAMDKFSHHMWYLSEELSGIAFFDNTLEASEKVAMVKALKKPGVVNPLVRPKIDVANVKEYKISDFITFNSLAIFRALNISQEFLNTDPHTWSNREDYIKARNSIKKLNVVNDVAERGCALATILNGKLTNSEEQMQFLLQGVENHRKKMPNANKKTVLTCLKQN